LAADFAISMIKKSKRGSLWLSVDFNFQKELIRLDFMNPRQNPLCNFKNVDEHCKEMEIVIQEKSYLKNNKELIQRRSEALREMILMRAKEIGIILVRILKTLECVDEFIRSFEVDMTIIFDLWEHKFRPHVINFELTEYVLNETPVYRSEIPTEMSWFD
jgi:hypothetical protein